MQVVQQAVEAVVVAAQPTFVSFLPVGWLEGLSLQEDRWDQTFDDWKPCVSWPRLEEVAWMEQDRLSGLE
jgi:hypothetical protein